MQSQHLRYVACSSLAIFPLLFFPLCCFRFSPFSPVLVQSIVLPSPLSVSFCACLLFVCCCYRLSVLSDLHSQHPVLTRLLDSAIRQFYDVMREPTAHPDIRLPCTRTVARALVQCMPCQVIFLHICTLFVLFSAVPVCFLSCFSSLCFRSLLLLIPCELLSCCSCVPALLPFHSPSISFFSLCSFVLSYRSGSFVASFRSLHAVNAVPKCRLSERGSCRTRSALRAHALFLFSVPVCL